MKLNNLPLWIGALISVVVQGQDNSCNVQVGNLDLQNIISGGLNANQLSLFPPTSVNNGAATLFTENDGGAIAGFWFVQEFRLTDGFRATFTYTANGGTSDGFGFVLQNVGVVNTIVGGGPALGFNDNGLSRFLGVGFDFCVDRTGSCDVDNMIVVTKTEGNAANVVATVDISSLGLDTGSHNVQIDYLAIDQILEVFVNGNSLARVENINLLDIFGDQLFGFLGVTGASSDENAATPIEIRISNLQVAQMNSGFRLSDESISQEVSPGDGVLIRVLLVDSCNGQLPAGVAGPIAEEDIVGFLRDTSNTIDDIPLSLADIQINDNELLLEANTDPGLEVEYTMFLTIGGVAVQLTPLQNAVSTVVPPPGGLSPAGIGLLSGLLALLVIAVIAIVMGVRKYRAQLIEHKDDIDHGKTKQQIDKIDKTITYELNPMAAPLDELKERLAANEKKIEQLKAEQKDAEDSDFHLTQLREENEGLRAQMAELRRKKEFGDVGNSVAAVPRKNFSNGNDKAEFGQDQV